LVDVEDLALHGGLLSESWGERSRLDEIASSRWDARGRRVKNGIAARETRFDEQASVLPGGKKQTGRRATGREAVEQNPLLRKRGVIGMATEKRLGDQLETRF
jgi:hypothetical protein